MEGARVPLLNTWEEWKPQESAAFLWLVQGGDPPPGLLHGAQHPGDVCGWVVEEASWLSWPGKEPGSGVPGCSLSFQDDTLALSRN